MSTPASTREAIVALLDALPDESLPLVEQFVRSLSSQTSGPGQSRYPTVFVSAETLAGFENLLAEGYEGDALADTEALYDGS